MKTSKTNKVKSTQSDVEYDKSIFISNLSTPKIQHTAGEWFTEECANGGLVVVLGERDQRVQIIDEKKAKLIAEAGNVSNETGLSPRQILEQRDMLLSVLYKVQDGFGDQCPAYILSTIKEVTK